MHKVQAFVFCIFLFAAIAAFGQPVAGWTEASGNTTTPNNVGIGGVTTPLSILHVAKNLSFVNGSDAQGIFSGTGSSPLPARAPASPPLNAANDAATTVSDRRRAVAMLLSPE